MGVNCEAMKLQVRQQSTTSPAFLDCEPSLLPSLGFKRLRPLVPRIAAPAPVVDAAAAAATKISFSKHVQQVQYWKPNSSLPVAAGRNPTPYLESQQQQQSGGGTRWNPAPEQIEALEALYRGGMRTPNARQIEQITAQLGSYGKIEGKNVFYWFQNHKARERQKQKRDALALGLGGSSGGAGGVLCCHHRKRGEKRSLRRQRLQAQMQKLERGVGRTRRRQKRRRR